MRPAPGPRHAVLLLAAGLLAACAGAPRRAPAPAAGKVVVAPSPKAESAPRKSPYAPAQEDLSKRGDYVAGGLYAPHVKDSAPDDLPDVDAIPEPEVKAEPRSRYGNRSYSVLGKRYQVMDRAAGYVEQGMASYYGKKFHGRRTSSLEVYDMYAMSAAHKTLPLPSYARVRNLANGKEVVVRVNDRGPFHQGRIIDLSYAAAVKLGIHRSGVAKVEVRALEPGGATLAEAPTPTPAARPEPVVQAPEPPAAALPAATPVPAAGNAAAGNAPRPAADAVTLQVASFTTRDNAERALARLLEAGIANARLLDARSPAGESLWRLRVGPVEGASLEEIGARMRGLGFGPPNVVRD